MDSFNRKGRNPELVKKRDICLTCRYYYWSEVKKLRFDYVLEILQNEEFFISKNRIQTIIYENASYFDSLVNGDVNVLHLRRDYRNFVW